MKNSCNQQPYKNTILMLTDTVRAAAFPESILCHRDSQLLQLSNTGEKIQTKGYEAGSHEFGQMPMAGTTS
jgi:hypothetical protein